MMNEMHNSQWPIPIVGEGASTSEKAGMPGRSSPLVSLSGMFGSQVLDGWGKAAMA